MRKICFVTCGALPVPAIKGGAIEQLIELLINENERTPKFEFTVVECCDSKVEQEFKKYKYTHFVQLKHPKSRENTNFTTFTDYIIKISSSIAQKISHSTIKRKYD